MTHNQKTKTDFKDITMHQVVADDAALKKDIPRLAYQQAASHDVNFPLDVILKSQQNFSDIIGRSGVDVWMIQEPSYAAGAIFTSVLKIGEKIGLQGEDAIVNETERGNGFGSALICFRARLAKENGFSFVGWECEDGDSASIHQRHKVFKALGGQKREGVKPFRLGKNVIDSIGRVSSNAIQEVKIQSSYQSMLIKDYTWEGGSATVSPRFSLFRTLGRGNVADETGYNQTSSGIQIENLQFDDLAKAREAVKTILKTEDATGRRCAFADVIADVSKPQQIELVASFDAAQNTYSGNPSFLWILEGPAFEKAAARAVDLKIG